MNVLPLRYHTLDGFSNTSNKNHSIDFLLPNPSDSNEILICFSNNLEICGYNVVNKQYKTYVLANWPTIITDEYNDIYSECVMIHDSVQYCVAKGTKQHTLSVVGCFYAKNNFESKISFFAVLNTKTWQLEEINKRYHFQFFPNTSLCGFYTTILTYKHYLITIGGHWENEQSGFIVDVKVPDNALVVKHIPLTKEYGIIHHSLINNIDDQNNCINILIFGSCKKYFYESFCQLTINFDTLNYSVNDEPDIQNHLVAGCKMNDTRITTNKKVLSNNCETFVCHLWYKNRYLILFGEETRNNKASTNIVFYDSKTSIWNKCCYRLPFSLQFEKVIVVSHGSKQKQKYLHFIQNEKHTVMEFGEQLLYDQSWKIERLLWIGYYQVMKNDTSKTIRKMTEIKKAENAKNKFCLFSILPRSIVEYILLFLRDDKICLIQTECD